MICENCGLVEASFEVDYIGDAPDAQVEGVLACAECTYGPNGLKIVHENALVLPLPVLVQGCTCKGDVWDPACPVCPF